MRKIVEFIIKPTEQYSFLVTGFSRRTASRPGTTLSATTKAGRTACYAYPKPRRIELLMPWSL